VIALKISGLVPRVGGRRESIRPGICGEITITAARPPPRRPSCRIGGFIVVRSTPTGSARHCAERQFDAPNREVCTVSRPSTTTPRGVALNDPQFVEAARVFAERILAQSGDDAAKLRWAFRETTSRELKPEEGKILGSALQPNATNYPPTPRPPGG
jgi:hypothetical protein